MRSNRVPRAPGLREVDTNVDLEISTTPARLSVSNKPGKPTPAYCNDDLHDLQ
jgi:hypothetical protein